MQRHVLAVSVLTVIFLAACGQPLPEAPAQRAAPLYTRNGFVMNGFVMNGFVMNGFVMNGLATDGLSSDGLSGPGLLDEPFTQANILANDYLMDAMRSDPTAAKLLQYMWSCAMPAGTDTGIDLDGNPATGDGNGYDLLLTGALGLTSQWASGACDETCQRWVSACVLARTNAFGATVQLSVRGPNLTGTPGWPLEVDPTSEEATTFTRREGSFFGNPFATQTHADGTKVWTPTMTACAGPASDIPYLSLRFCSSTEDDCPINTVGNCAEDTAYAPAACDTTLGPSGESTNCYSDPNNKTAANLYQQVVTVYLNHDLEAVCGNHICETEGGETNDSCPSDCDPDTWATRIEMGTGLTAIAFRGEVGLTSFDQSPDFNFLALDPSDDAVTGGYSAGDVDLGGGTLAATRGEGYLAKYSAKGAHLWSERIGAMVNAVATDSSGNIAVEATVHNGVSNGKVYDRPGTSASVTVGTTTGAYEVLLAMLDADGNRKWVRTFGGPGSGVAFADGDDRGSRALVADRSGNWILGGSFYGTGSFGQTLTSVGGADAFVTKVSASGTPLWGVRLGGSLDDRASGISLDDAGQVLVTTTQDDSDTMGLYLLDASGAAKWGRTYPKNSTTLANVKFHKAIFDSSGMIYVAGTISGVYDLGTGAIDGGTASFFLAQYDGSGAVKWVKTVPGKVDVQDLRIDSYGDVIVFGQYVDPGIDFGAGPFSSHDPDTFLVSYKPNGDFVWAMPMTGYGNNLPVVGQGRVFDDSALFTGFGIDSKGHVVGTGVMDGFFLFNDRMLVNWVAPLSYDADAFVGSFVPPCSADACDTIPPVFVPDSVSAMIVVQANKPADASGPNGTDVWFNTPLATDRDNAGHYGTATVACAPASGSRFPIGITNVICTAYDAHGNTATAGFKVEVRNALGPTIVNPPPKGPYAARSGAGVIVTFNPAPTAIDQIDGTLQPTCSPASGSTFPIGITTVTCTAQDKAGNIGRGTFPIWVTPVPTGKPPATPTNVVAVAGVRQAVISWTGSSTNDATKYTIGYAVGAAGIQVDGTQTSLTVTGLANGGTYTFTVTASNSAGSSAAASSNTVTLPNVPGAPTNVKPVAGAGQVSLSWTAPKSDGGSAILGYAVSCYLGGKNLARTVYPDKTSATVTGLADNSSYDCSVQAVNAVGTSAIAWSAYVTTAPPSPTQVSASGGIRSAVVSWAQSTGATSYTVTSNPGSLTATVGGSQTQATVTGLANGGTYTFTVVAANAQASSLPSAASNAVSLPDLPGAPTNVTATAGIRQASVSWSAPSSDGGSPLINYRVEAYAGASLVTVVNPTATSVTLSNLDNGTTYSFVVKAVNAVGTGPGTTSPSVSTPPLPPSPTNVRAVAGLRAATVSWTGAAGVTSFTVTSSPGNFGVTVAGNQSSVNVTGLQAGGTYTFTVVATDTVGTSAPSAPSNAVTMPSTTKQASVPGAPTNVHATAAVKAVSVWWSPPVSNGGSAILGYRVDCYVGTSLVATVNPTTTSVTVSGLADHTTYACTVRARNAVGLGTASGAPWVTTP